MVTTNQKSVIGIHTQRNPNTKDSHQITRQQKEGEKNTYKNHPQRIHKMKEHTYQ